MADKERTHGGHMRGRQKQTRHGHKAVPWRMCGAQGLEANTRRTRGGHKAGTQRTKGGRMVDKWQQGGAKADSIKGRKADT